MLSSVPLGPLVVDLAKDTITAAEQTRLQHPAVGGVILFARNFTDLKQFLSLIQELKKLREPNLLIMIDHEGGKVQRLREGFKKLPPFAKLGEAYNIEAEAALAWAKELGTCCAQELIDAGIDLSLSPVLDLDYGQSHVMHDRCLHRDPQVVIQLASAFISGLNTAGMQAIGKHFPGHGYAKDDSHLVLPHDPRNFRLLEQNDLVPYRRLKKYLGGIMLAHIVYAKVDPKPTTYSPLWHKILREDIGYQGAILSDDLSMEAASIVGDMAQRVEYALRAGCQLLLICNASGDTLDATLASRKSWPDMTRIIASLYANPIVHSTLSSGEPI